MLDQTGTLCRMENELASIGSAMQVKASIRCCCRQVIAQKQEPSPTFLTHEGATISEAIIPLEGSLQAGQEAGEWGRRLLALGVAVGGKMAHRRVHWLDRPD